MDFTLIIAVSTSFAWGLGTGYLFAIRKRVKRKLKVLRIKLIRQHADKQAMRASLYELYEKGVELMTKDNLFLTDINEDEFVALLGTNRIYFARALRTYGEGGFRNFLNTMRVRYIINVFIQNPNLSASDMAAMAGFNSLTAFTRPFKHETGMTPGRWCNRYRLTGEI